MVCKRRVSDCINHQGVSVTFEIRVFVLWNEWQINGFRSDWNDWCVQGGFTQDPSVPAAPLMEGFVLAKQEGVIRGQYMEAVASSGRLLQSAERGYWQPANGLLKDHDYKSVAPRCCC